MRERGQPVMTGGCQCGAVRYALHGEPDNPHVCHCRMCQKAFGGYFAPLAGVAIEDFELTRGTLATFRSSEPVERGFCRDCGTPLTFRYVGTDRISVALGSLDEPARVRPARQFGVESRMPWFDTLAGLPGDTTEDLGAKRPDLFAAIARSNRQHPDRDTDGWPDTDRRP